MLFLPGLRDFQGMEYSLLNQDSPRKTRTVSPLPTIYSNILLRKHRGSTLSAFIGSGVCGGLPRPLEPKATTPKLVMESRSMLYKAKSYDFLMKCFPS